MYVSVDSPLIAKTGIPQSETSEAATSSCVERGFEAIRSLGVALPLTSLPQQLCTATADAGHGGDDLAALITTLEKMAGLGPA